MAFYYVLLERPLYPFADDGMVSRLVLGIPIMVINGFFTFFAYIFILYSVINFIFPGAIANGGLLRRSIAVGQPVQAAEVG